uniref:Glycoprotein n=1 Tax=Hymenopteran phasma-related virus OKIAV233 TaxID=2792587 RepID=A0A7T0M3P2_9VIRU|nr:glycoprotein [Hymenopteran phasma-related virus OKIAV233]
MEIIKKFILLFTLIQISIQFSITARYGKVNINSLENCTLILNGTKIYTDNNKIPGLHYGLIQYECGHKTGFILSKPECYECGIYCPQNDRLLNCRQFGLPYALGIITGLITSIIVTIFLHKWGLNLIHTVFSSFNNNRKLRREQRYGKYLSKYTGILEKNTKGSATESTNGCSNNIIKYPSLTNIAVSTLLVTADRTYACDRTLFMHSNGQVCDKVRCQNINSYSFNVGIGNTICFNTPSREMMKFEVIHTKEMSSYQQLYYTSDFEIELESTSSCKQVGLCFNEYCHKGAKHPDFRNKTDVHGYSCDAEGLGCEFMCWHKYACTWYVWWLRNIGSKATIYKRTYSLWSFDLKVSFKNITRIYNFNSEITQYDLDIGRLFSDDNMPINVNNVIKLDLTKSDYIIRDYFSFYEVSANDINNLTPGRLGDYQISLNDEQSIFKTNEVICQTSGCKVMCSAPEPTLRVFRALKHKNIISEYNVDDEYTVRTLKHIPMTISLTIGNVEFKNLFVEPANCEFEVLHTFGCIGCDKYPYAVIQATKIVSHGVLPFISNCSFNLATLSCGYTITNLIPKSQYNICNVYIPSTNRSLNIEFKYEFFGELSIPEEIYSHDNGFKGIIKSITENPNFLDTLTYSMFAFTGIGLVSSIIIKVTFRLIALRQSNNVNKELSNN